jgi:hypothetical protein
VLLRDLLFFLLYHLLHRFDLLVPGLGVLKQLLPDLPVLLLFFRVASTLEQIFDNLLKLAVFVVPKLQMFDILDLLFLQLSQSPVQIFVLTLKSLQRVLALL